MQTEMKHKSPDVKFILEAFVGRLMALAVEGHFLPEDRNFESLKNRTLPFASPIECAASDPVWAT